MAIMLSCVSFSYGYICQFFLILRLEYVLTDIPRWSLDDKTLTIWLYSILLFNGKNAVAVHSVLDREADAPCGSRENVS